LSVLIVVYLGLVILLTYFLLFVPPKPKLKQLVDATYIFSTNYITTQYLF